MIDCCVRVPHFALGNFLSDMWDFHGDGGRWMLVVPGIDGCLGYPRFCILWDFHGDGGHWMGWPLDGGGAGYRLGYPPPDSAHCGISTVTVAVGWCGR